MAEGGLLLLELWLAGVVAAATVDSVAPTSANGVASPVSLGNFALALVAAAAAGGLSLLMREVWVAM